MLVADLKIDDEYIFVKKNTTVQEVAKKLLQGYYGTALVMDGDDIVGAITLDIIVAKTVVQVKNPVETTAGEIMDTRVVKVKKSTSIKDVDAQIREVKPSAVVVYDEQGTKVLGYVSPLDMMEALQSIK